MRFMPRIAKLPTPEVEAARAVVANFLRTSGQTETQFANAANVKQYAVSRLVTGRMKGMTAGVHAMRSYALNWASASSSLDLAGDPKLLAAIEQAWDGTEAGRDLIAAAISALAPVLRQAARRTAN